MSSKSTDFQIDTVARELDQLSLRDLNVLAMITEVGTVSGAAMALEISQPTASYSLEKMRRIFRDNLFESRQKRLHPTELCIRLANVARSAIVGVRRASIPANQPVSAMSGDVTILHRGNDWRYFDDLNTKFLTTAPYGRLLYSQTGDANTDQYLGTLADFFVGISGLQIPDVKSHTKENLPFMMVFNPANVDPPTDVASFLRHRYAVSWLRTGIAARGMGAVDSGLAKMGAQARTIGFASHSVRAIARVLWETDLIYTGSIHSLPPEFEGLYHAPLPFEVASFRIGVRWLPEARNNPLVAHALDLAIEALDRVYDPVAGPIATTPWRGAV